MPKLKKMTAAIVGSVLISLSACGDGGSEDGVGGISASEADALNEAAEMLDSRPNAITAEPKPAQR